MSDLPPFLDVYQECFEAFSRDVADTRRLRAMMTNRRLLSELHQLVRQLRVMHLSGAQTSHLKVYVSQLLSREDEKPLHILLLTSCTFGIGSSSSEMTMGSSPRP